MKSKNWKIENVIGFVLLGISLYILGRLTGFCFSEDIWYDEVFSAGMMRYSYKEIMDFTAKDVHPPLYYWYLKSFADAGTSLFRQVDEVVFAKLASVLPLAGLWGLAVTKVRKEFGLLAAGIFVFCVLPLTPH